MANYNKSVNFAVKDTLQSGDPNKIVSGAEIDTEFNNISSSSTTKIDKVPAAVTNNVASFNATGALQDSGSPSTALIPSGGIIIWSGLLTAIPTGWSLCDGSNGTPDLRNRFVVGAGDQYDRNDIGGADSLTLTEAQIPSHTHTIDSSGNHNHSITDPGHAHTGIVGTGIDDSQLGTGSNSVPKGIGDVGTSTTGITVNSGGEHTHPINNTGGGQAHENRPPYFALAFIMKL